MNKIVYLIVLLGVLTSLLAHSKPMTCEGPVFFTTHKSCSSKSNAKIHVFKESKACKARSYQPCRRPEHGKSIMEGEEVIFYCVAEVDIIKLKRDYLRQMKQQSIIDMINNGECRLGDREGPTINELTDFKDSLNVAWDVVPPRASQAYGTDWNAYGFKGKFSFSDGENEYLWQQGWESFGRNFKLKFVKTPYIAKHSPQCPQITQFHGRCRDKSHPIESNAKHPNNQCSSGPNFWGLTDPFVEIQKLNSNWVAQATCSTCDEHTGRGRLACLEESYKFIARKRLLKRRSTKKSEKDLGLNKKNIGVAKIMVGAQLVKAQRDQGHKDQFYKDLEKICRKQKISHSGGADCYFKLVNHTLENPGPTMLGIRPLISSVIPENRFGLLQALLEKGYDLESLSKSLQDDLYKVMENEAQRASLLGSLLNSPVNPDKLPLGFYQALLFTNQPFSHSGFQINEFSQLENLLAQFPQNSEKRLLYFQLYFESAFARYFKHQRKILKSVTAILRAYKIYKVSEAKNVIGALSENGDMAQKLSETQRNLNQAAVDSGVFASQLVVSLGTIVRDQQQRSEAVLEEIKRVTEQFFAQEQGKSLYPFYSLYFDLITLNSTGFNNHLRDFKKKILRFKQPGVLVILMDRLSGFYQALVQGREDTLSVLTKVNMEGSRFAVDSELDDELPEFPVDFNQLMAEASVSANLADLKSQNRWLLESLTKAEEVNYKRFANDLTEAKATVFSALKDINVEDENKQKQKNKMIYGKYIIDKDEKGYVEIINYKNK